jgi:hypothetical protein
MVKGYGLRVRVEDVGSMVEGQELRVKMVQG